MNPSETTPARERIVTVAERAFLQAGFSRVLMDDLAHELGMSKKTLYAHFDSKERLLRAVLDHRIAAVDSQLKALTEASLPFPEKLRQLAYYLHAKIAEVSTLFMEDIRRYAPECFHVVENFRGHAIPLYFGRLLDEGIRSGHVQEQLSRELLIRMLVLSIQGIVRPEVMSELRLSPSAALDHILTIIFRGILTAKGRRIPGSSPRL